MYLESEPIPGAHCAALPTGWQSIGGGLGGRPPLGTAERPHHRIDCAAQPTHSTHVRPSPTYSQQNYAEHTVCHRHSMTPDAHGNITQRHGLHEQVCAEYALAVSIPHMEDSLGVHCHNHTVSSSEG